MGLSPILAVIHAVTIGTVLNLKGYNNRYGPKNVTCEQTLKVFGRVALPTNPMKIVGSLGKISFGDSNTD